MTESFSEIPETEHAVSLFDESEPRSLVNIIWTHFRPVIERTAKSHPELFDISEARLKKKAKPEPQHTMLRLRFWQEYDIAQNGGRKMMLKDVTRGICSMEFWSRQVCTTPELVAYIITPPPSYLTKMQSMLDISLDGMTEILELPIKDERGKVDTRLIAEKVKIFQLLDLRVKGAIMQKVAIHQRIDQRTQITGGKEDPLSKMDLNDLESLEANIQRVKKQIDRVQSREMILLDKPKVAMEGMILETNVGTEVESGSNEAAEIEDVSGAEEKRP